MPGRLSYRLKPPVLRFFGELAGLSLASLPGTDPRYAAMEHDETLHVISAHELVNFR